MKIDDVISAACEELGVGYENNALWFELLTNQAIETFNTATKLDIYQECLKTQDSRICLPKNYSKFVNLKNKYGHCWIEGVDFSIQGRYIIFSSKLDIPDDLDVVLRYKGLALDEDGEIYMPDKWERMLVSYICYKYSRKYHKDYPAYIIQDYKKEFAQQKASNG
jgi:hypothetical protein